MSEYNTPPELLIQAVSVMADCSPDSADQATHLNPYGRQAIKDIVRLVERLQSALGTEETGEALVEVARNACRAEQELAALERRLLSEEFPQTMAQLEGLAIGLEQRGEKSATHLIRKVIALIQPS